VPHHVGIGGADLRADRALPAPQAAGLGHQHRGRRGPRVRLVVTEWYPLTVDLGVLLTHHDLRAGEGRHLPHLTVRGHEPRLPAAQRRTRAGHDPPLKETRDTCHGVAVPVRVRNTYIVCKSSGADQALSPCPVVATV